MESTGTKFTFAAPQGGERGSADAQKSKYPLSTAVDAAQLLQTHNILEGIVR